MIAVMICTARQTLRIIKLRWCAWDLWDREVRNEYIFCLEAWRGEALWDICACERLMLKWVLRSDV